MMGAVEGGNQREDCRSGRRVINGRDAQTGSITAEASIIIPLVILCIAAVIYIGLLMYQRSLIQSAAEMAAEAGAAAWASGTGAIVTSRPAHPESKDFRLYRRIFDSGRDQRLKRIEEYAMALSSQNEIVTSSGTAAEARVIDYAVYRKLEVTVIKHYKIPLGRLVMLFGGSDTVTISVKAVSTINDPAEFIRTADLVIDIEKKLESKFPELKKIGDKTREALNGIKDKLGDFMD